MKKTLSFIIAFMMMLMPTMSSFALSNESIDEQNIEIQLSDSVIDVLINAESKVMFYAETEINRSVKLYDENNNFVAEMHDDGIGADETALDGIYSAEVTFNEDEIHLVNYVAKSGSSESNAVEINFYREFTNAEFGIAKLILDRIYAMNDELKLEGVDSNVITDKVFEFLSDSPYIKNVVRENSNMISFWTNAGIGCGFDSTVYESESNITEVVSEMLNGIEGMNNNATVKAAQMWSNPDVLIYSPFKNSSYTSTDSGFNNENDKLLAMQINEITGGTYKYVINERCTPNNFLSDIPYYGFIFFDGHGMFHNGQSYFCFRNTAGGYSSADVSAGRAFLDRADIVSIGGSYIQAHLSKKLPGSVFYAGSCLGMQSNTTGNILLNLGCTAYIGYTTSVSMDYETQMARRMWKYLCKTLDDNPNRTYSVSEAIAKAKSDLSPSDPYYDDVKYGGRSVLKCLPSNSGFRLLNGESHVNINFNTDGNGTLNGTTKVSVKYGEKIDSDIIPWGKPGYRFAGWFKGSEEIDLSTFVPMEDMTITAKFVHVGGDEYLITLPEQLTDIQNIGYNKNYKILEDIDMSGLEFTPIAKDNEFNGSLNGDNHVISNLSINMTNTKYVGFIDTVGANGIVKNVIIDNAQIAGKAVVGIIAAKNQGSIVHCVVNNSNVRSGGIESLSSNTMGQFVGGLVGYNDRDAKVSFCSVKNSHIVGTEKNAAMFHGGLVGYNFNATIEYSSVQDSYVDTENAPNGDVTSVGGLAGYSNGTVTYSFTSNSEINGTKKVGAIVGDSYGTVSYSGAWNNTVRGNATTVSHGIGSSSGRMEEVYFSNASDDKNESSTTHGEQVLDSKFIEGKDNFGWRDNCDMWNFESGSYPFLKEYAEVMHTVTFVDFFGKVIFVSYVADGDAAQAPEAPYVEGYKFVGWEDDFSEVHENMTIVPIYEIDDNPQPTPTPEPTPTPVVPDVVRGDADKNGEVDSADATVVLRYVASLTNLVGDELANADANEDGTIDSADATSILRFVANLGW